MHKGGTKNAQLKASAFSTIDIVFGLAQVC